MSKEAQPMVTIQRYEIAPVINYYDREIADKKLKLKVYRAGKIDTYLRDNQSPPPTTFTDLEPTHQEVSLGDAEKYVDNNPDDQQKEWQGMVDEYTMWKDTLSKNKDKAQIRVPADHLQGAILTGNGWSGISK